MYKTFLWGFFHSILVTILVLALTFGFLLPIQAKEIARAVHHEIDPHIDVWIWLVTVLLCLAEVAAGMLLAVVIFLPLFLDSVFDRVLLLKGIRSIQPDKEGLARRSVGLSTVRSFQVAGRLIWRRWNKDILFSGVQIITLLASFPMNLVPGIGTAVWVVGNGLVLGWENHLHYLMDYRGMTLLETRDYVWEHKAEYTAFGATAFMLHMVPLANFVFAVCSTVGAALWAVDIEKSRGNHPVNLIETPEDTSDVEDFGICEESGYGSNLGPNSNLPSGKNNAENVLYRL